MARGHSARFMGAPFSIRHEHGAVIISVTRAIDEGLFSKLDAEFRRVPVRKPFIINLSALTLGSSRAVEQLVGFLRSLSGPRVCLVCSRLSARKLLRSAGAADLVPVFMTTADAVQAVVAPPPRLRVGLVDDQPDPRSCDRAPQSGEARCGMTAGSAPDLAPGVPPPTL